MSRIIYCLVFLLAYTAATASFAGLQSGASFDSASKTPITPFLESWGIVDEGDDSQDLATGLGVITPSLALTVSAKQADQSTRVFSENPVNYHCRAPPLIVPV